MSYIIHIWATDLDDNTHEPVDELFFGPYDDADEARKDTGKAIDLLYYHMVAGFDAEGADDGLDHWTGYRDWARRMVEDGGSEVVELLTVRTP